METLELTKSVLGLVVTIGLFGVVTYGIKKAVDLIPSDKLEKLM